VRHNQAGTKGGQGGPEGTTRPRMLHGRDAERSVIAGLLNSAQAFRSGVLVLRGRAGAGKSALLQDAVERAAGMQVLRARGIESEAELAFAALHQLLRPALHRVDSLPQPQEQALRAAFGLEQGAGDDRFLVSVAVLSLLAEAAEKAPVLCIVDDAHWLDNGSANALVFVARRLEAERVALLFAARDGEVRRFDASGLPELEIGGLDPAAVGALLADRAGVTVDQQVRDQLAEQTGGNPLALVELPSVLTPGQLAGKEPLPPRLPLTEGVGRAFLERVRRLPGDAQTFLLVAAAEDTGRLATVVAAAATLGAGPAALDAAERAGLIGVRTGELDFRHPLVRSAVYQGATTTERRQVHRALAGVLDRETDGDRRAWHGALAAVEPDEAIVQELEETARRARARGGLEAACAAFERAAELTAAQEPRARRLTAAADNAWLAGQLTRASGLLHVARSLTSNPLLLADIDRLRSWIELSAGSALAARQILLQAARDVAPSDPRRALEMLVAAAEAAWVASDAAAGAEIAQLAAALQPGDEPRARFFVRLLAGFSQLLDGNVERAIDALRDAIRLAESLDQTDLISHADHAALYVGDDARAYSLNAQAVARARAAGAVGDLVFALQRLALAEIVTGRWTAAAASAAEALRLARETGQPELSAPSLAWLALLAALRGDEDGFRSLVADTGEVTAAHRIGVLEGQVHDAIHWAHGIHEAAAGRPASAMTWFEAMAHPAVAPMAAALDRIEAAVHADRRDTALEWLHHLEAFAERAAVPWAQAEAAHCRGLLSDGDAAQQQLEQALEHHRRAQRPFERARTELAYGEFLRRGRRRVDARTHLRAALDVFEQLGAGPWAERARLELRASGQTARKRDPSTILQLTPQELQVARFVAMGLPTRDVAAQLFLSPRTIDFHLRNVFAKLGISSRAQLAHLPLDQ
jgi:DNA-binding CsgD family transcriptional regulator